MQKIGVVINTPDDVKKTNDIYQKIQEVAFDNDLELLLEVNGLKKSESVLTEDDLNEINTVLIISDEEYKKEKFVDKNLIEAWSNEALENTQEVFEKILEVEGLQQKESVDENQNNLENNNTQQKSSLYSKKIYTHLRNGANIIIPFVIVSAILTIFVYFFELDLEKASGFPGTIARLATGVSAFIIPVLSAFIAYSIANKDGFISGLIGGAFASVLNTGFIGGIIVGMVAGYITKYTVEKVKVSNKLLTLKSIAIVPIISILLVGLFTMYIIAPASNFIYDNVEVWIRELNLYNIVLLCAIIGLFVSFDLGGVFSKATLAAVTTLAGTGIFVPQAAAFAAAMVPPLGLALATVASKEKFTLEEREFGKTAWLFGISGLSEGAIPFAVSDPLRVIPSSMIGSGLTGVLIGIFSTKVKVANGGIFALQVSQAISNLLEIVFAVVVGVFVTAFLVKYLKKDLTKETD